jgi:enoyl-CoA hydratase/carnithine racemase
MTHDQAAAAGVFERVAPSAEMLLETAMAWVCEQKQGARERDGAPRKWIGRPDRAAAVLAAVDEVKEEVGKTETGAAVIKAVEAGLSRGWDAAIEVERRELVRLRHTAAAKERLAAFFAKSKK